jgi:hypothetical protein
MAKTFQRPQSLYDRPTHYCPGCTHGVAHRLIAEVIDELEIGGRSVGLAPVGCAVLMYDYVRVDFQEASHGRAPAMATGIKRVRPDLIVFTYQGDGDLASIGMGEIVHHNDFHQQCGVRYDRRPDGSYHAARPENHDYALRAQTRGDGHAHPDGGASGLPGDPGVYHPAIAAQTQTHQQGQEGCATGI